MNGAVLVPIAHGTEEMEAVIIIDILRRADINVIVAGDNSIVACSRKVKILPDCLLDEISEDAEFSAIILPGGAAGVKNLSKSRTLASLIKKLADRQGIIGAICAAPSLLHQYKLLPDRFTSHPSIKESLKGGEYSEDNVVISGNFISSRGAGTAFEFALSLVSLLKGESQAGKIRSDIVLNI
jgi:DJ-1 family protein